MKLKFFFSALTLLLFSLLGGGSAEEIGGIFTVIIVAVVLVVIAAVVVMIVESQNKKKRLQMIQDDEKNSSDFDRNVFIGDDRCKIYFDSKQQKAMIMRVTTEGIKKYYVDDFEFSGKDLSAFNFKAFSVYDSKRRKLLTGAYTDTDVTYKQTSISEYDGNKDVAINNTIASSMGILRTSTDIEGLDKVSEVLVDEKYGLIVVSESGNIKKAFNYVDASDIIKKSGDKSSVTIKRVGNYLFVMDDFFKKLVLISSNIYEVFNYSDIIDVTYEENGSQLYSKSTSRTVGGAIVGGMLMGGAGAIVGGLSGASKASKEVKNMDLKMLLRMTNRTSFVYHFKDVDRVLQTKEEHDAKLYEKYLKHVNQAKDILSVIIDSAKQTVATPVQPEPSASQNSGVADELSKLAKLKADGILTEEEFQSQKSKLLGL